MKALTFLLFLAAAGLGGWAVYEHMERSRLEKELTAITRERNALAKTARDNVGLKGGVEIKEDGPRGLKDLGSPLEDEEKKPADSTAKIPGDKTESPTGDLSKMMRDPAMRDMMRAQAGAQLDLEYRDLFDLLNLDDKKRDAVMDLIKARMGTQMDLGFKAVDKELSAEARAEAAAALTKSMAESSAKIKEQLGADYDKFERFEKSKPERDQLKVLGTMMKDQGLSLDETTESKLMDAMYSERQSFKFERDLSDMTKVQPDNLSSENVDLYLEQNAMLQQQIQAKAKGILSQEQYEVFLKSQESQQQMMQMGLKMWQKMTLGTGEADARD